KLRVDALFSCSQALNRADFKAERQTSPREFRAANFECNPELQINRQTSRRRLSRLLPGFEIELQTSNPSRRELRIPNFELSTSNSAPNFKSSGILLVDDLSGCSQL